MSDWKKEAIRLARFDGISWRKIAKELGVPRSTVSDYLRKELTPEKAVKEFNSKKAPRILLFDIETAPLIAQMWSLWQNGFGLNQLQEDWFIMSFAAKWLGEDTVMYFDQSEAKNMEDDTPLLEKLWQLLDEADIVVGQNSKKFDVKKVFGRFVMSGLPKPSTFRQIDTLEIAKQQFALTSNKLQYLTDKLCVNTKKSAHKKFPGHELWSECLKGNKEAWQEMKEYNIDDVISLEELYNLFCAWDNKLPNFDVYVDEVLDNSEWMEDGFHYTNLGKYQRYRNINTGQQRRSRVNLLTKEKRQSLLANIV